MNGQRATLGRLADFPPYQLSVTSNEVSSAIADRYRARFGLKITEWRVMAVLGDRGPTTQRELTDATMMDKVAVNRACKVLEERGILVRQPNAKDGRSHLLDLTAEGCEMHDEVMPFAKGIEDEIYAVLSQAERDQLCYLLGRLFKSAESMRPAAR